MLVEINLLPKKEHKTTSLLAVTLILLCIFALGSSVFLWQARTNEASVKKLNEEIAKVQSLNTALQTKVMEQENSDSAADLQSAVIWAEKHTPETVRLLRSLIALLPEQGFIQTLSYDGVGIVNVRVEFESSRDAAYFLSSLKHSEWVNNASILTVEAVKEDESESDSDSNTEDMGNITLLPTYSAEFEVDFEKEFFTQEYENKGGNES